MSEFRIDRPLPPFMTQLHGLSKDVFRHSINTFKKVDDIIFNTRLSECNKCEEYRSGEHSPTNQRLKGASKAKPKDCVPSLKIFKDALWSLSHTKPQQEQ